MPNGTNYILTNNDISYMTVKAARSIIIAIKGGIMVTEHILLHIKPSQDNILDILCKILNKNRIYIYIYIYILQVSIVYYVL